MTPTIVVNCTHGREDAERATAGRTAAATPIGAES